MGIDSLEFDEAKNSHVTIDPESEQYYQVPEHFLGTPRIQQRIIQHYNIHPVGRHGWYARGRLFDDFSTHPNSPLRNMKRAIAWEIGCRIKEKEKANG